MTNPKESRDSGVIQFPLRLEHRLVNPKPLRCPIVVFGALNWVMEVIANFIVGFWD